MLLCVPIYIYIYTYFLYMYICIERERERERARHICSVRRVVPPKGPFPRRPPGTGPVGRPRRQGADGGSEPF